MPAYMCMYAMAGVGAAGAGGTGTLGEAVLVFDGDHESPELIWDATCRFVCMCVCVSV